MSISLLLCTLPHLVCTEAVIHYLITTTNFGTTFFFLFSFAFANFGPWLSLSLLQLLQLL